jgi:lysophospholipase L1-like esterase
MPMKPWSKRSIVLRAVACATFALTTVSASAAEPAAARWQSEFAAFARADEAHKPARGGVVFVGSSSIRLWDGLETAFERFPTVLKRGFGGSTMSDCVEHVGRLVLAYEPRLVVLYAGENDLAAGESPAAVSARVREFIELVRRAQPATHIAYVSIKPSPLRAAVLPAIRETNERVRDYIATVPNAQYIDVHSAMLGADGQPRGELFGADRLHMNAAGYTLWRREINARLP